MAICPAGHQTTARDFCDTCGLPVPAQASAPAVGVPPETAAPSAAEPVICPNCRTPNVADALFCEACGYDFTTGSVPAAAAGPAGAAAMAAEAPMTVQEEPEAPVTAEPEPVVEAPVTEAEVADTDVPEAAEAAADASPDGGEEAGAPASDAAVEAPASPEDAAAGPVATSPAPVAEVAEPPVAEAFTPTVVPVAPVRPAVEWVAELWIDPDWYAAQGSTDPMPSPSLPDIVPLVKESNLIGRVSHSRGIFPDIDCELDTGCSRRHAMLSTDGSRWWIEDLDSANGTFVGAAAGPLPAMPIPQGRVELNPGQRIYVGAWTRIVVRQATDDEKDAFA